MAGVSGEVLTVNVIVYSLQVVDDTLSLLDCDSPDLEGGLAMKVWFGPSFSELSTLDGL